MAWISLVPWIGRDTHPFRACLVCGHEGAAAGVVLNIILYMPLGFYLARRTGSTFWAVAGGLALTLCVEFAQLQIPGRYSTLEDILANTLGAGLGGFAAFRLRSWLFPRGTGLSPQGVSWAFCAAALIALPGLLLSSSVPDDDVYVQWHPRIPGTSQYEGRGIEARIDDIGLETGRVHDTEGIRRGIADGEIVLTFEKAPSPRRYAPVWELIVGPYDHGEDVLQIGIDGEDLLIWERYAADDLSLDRPLLRVGAAMADRNDGERVTLRLGRAADGARLLAVDDDDEVRLGYTAARGWSLLRFRRRSSEALQNGLDLIWLLGLFLPLGWWGASARHAVLLASAPLALIAIVPGFTPLNPTPALHYLVAVAGVGLGCWLRSSAASISTSLPDGTPC